MRHWISIVSAWFAVLAAPLLACAQPLADRVPQDALIYIGWKGVDSPGDAYAASRLKAVLDASDLPKYLHEVVPQLLGKITEMNHDPDAAQVVALLNSVGGPLWRHPSALYVGPVDFAQGMPAPHLALLCQAGNDAPAMLEEIHKLLAQLPPTPFPIVAEEHNQLVSVVVGTLDAAAQAAIQGTAQPGGASLLNNETFKKSRQQVGSDPVFCLYVDVEGILHTVDAVAGTVTDVNTGGTPEGVKTWGSIRDALGLDGIKRLICTGGFDGRAWSNQAFIEAPAPRKGILSLLGGAPISDDALKTIPKTATMCSAGRLNLAGLVQQVKATANQINPEVAQQMQMGLDQLNQMLGMDLEKDVLGVLGDEWTSFCDPHLGGDGMLGLVAVNHLADPAKAEETLGRLEAAINNLIHQNMGDAHVSLTIEQAKVGDLTVHYLDIPFIRPSWVIKDGNLYLSLYPQMAQAAAEYFQHKGPTILENPAFVALRQRLGGQKATSISFADLPQTAPGGYGMLTLISSYAALGDMMLGIKSPPMLMPPLPKLLAQLTPAGSVTWVDDLGWHMRGVTPFPSASLLSADPGMYVVAVPAMMAAILLPSLSRARETAYRIHSASDLKQIGTACMIYSNDHAGAYPPDLGTLVTDGTITFQVCFSPSHSVPAPPDKPADQAAYVNDHSDYVYLGSGKNAAEKADTVIAYEKPSVHQNVGANVLFADGHVDWLTRAAMEKICNEQNIEMQP